MKEYSVLDNEEIQENEKYSKFDDDFDESFIGSENDPIRDNINSLGVICSIASLLFGVASWIVLFMLDFNFLMWLICILCGGISVSISFPYWIKGFHHKVFGKIVVFGFFLGLSGIAFSIDRLITHIVGASWLILF